MAIIRISNTDKVALIDDDMYEELSKYKWHLQKGTNYAVRSLRDKVKVTTVSIHREILRLSVGDGKCVDHIDGNCLDNRRSNLRVCTYTQNECNKRITKANTSGYKGVSWIKRDKIWQARIVKGGKRIPLGHHENIINAAKAYNEAAIKYHGEFARLNKIPEGEEVEKNERI